MQILRDWFKRHLSDPQVVILGLFLLVGFVVIWWFGTYLAPALIAVVIAYLMEGLVTKLEKIRVPRFAAVTVVYLCFLVAFVLLLIGLLPRLVQQVEKFVLDVPKNVERLQTKVEELQGDHPWLFIEDDVSETALETATRKQAEAEALLTEDQVRLMRGDQGGIIYLPEGGFRALAEVMAPMVAKEFRRDYPELINTNQFQFVEPTVPGTNLVEVANGTPEPAEEAEVDAEEKRPFVNGLISPRFIDDTIRQAAARVAAFSGNILQFSVAAGARAVMVLVYLILVPLLILFFLKDKEKILGWFGSYLPENRALVNRVWRDVDVQIGNYVRGKFVEILIVWAVTYVTFQILGLDYAMLLALFVGLSVLIPYIGATVMIVPIVIVAFFQFGTTSQFWWVVGAYFIVQLLDGNVLAPLLLSEVTNLHPVAIIVAVLMFGGLWGFWGVFFAIPLATLVQAVLKAWPRTNRIEGSETADSRI